MRLSRRSFRCLEYDPFRLQIATPTASSGILDNPEHLQFTGHERDTAKLDYMHARYYAPGAGPFLSVDPVLNLNANVPHAQRWNRYSYVSNNPINKIDPDGREENFYMERLFREQHMSAAAKCR